MKAKLKGHIASLVKQNGDALITLGSMAGKTDPVKTSSQAQHCFLSGELRIKTTVADDMKIGSVITITITDDDEE